MSSSRMLIDAEGKPVVDGGQLLHESHDEPLQRLVTRLRWRLLPLLCLGYILALMDRANISFAELQSARRPTSQTCPASPSHVGRSRACSIPLVLDTHPLHTQWGLSSI